jgi:chaperone required for assembly of F1-ATPase
MQQAALAQAVAAEWNGVGASLSVDELPLTRLAGTAQHQVLPNATAMASALARYAEHDLLCYRSTHPEALAIRQHHAWQPWLDWAAATYGARLLLATTIMPIAQPPEALTALHDATLALSPYQLTALSVLVPSYGSLVLGLAVSADALAAGAALDLAQLDEVFQAEKWGEDAEAATRRANVARDVHAAAQFLALTT